MSDKITFDLVSPERLVLSEDAEMVTIPGSEGEMGVMAGHMPLIATLRPGMIAVSGGPGGEKRFFVSGGFAEVTAKKLTLLADEALPLSELDATAVGQRIAAAEEIVASAKSDIERAKAQELLDCLKGIKPAV
jgi:F-type H+-transporting ATPase subunit epsilon